MAHHSNSNNKMKKECRINKNGIKVCRMIPKKKKKDK